MNIRIYLCWTESWSSKNSLQQLLPQVPSLMQLKPFRYNLEYKQGITSLIGERLLLKMGLIFFWSRLMIWKKNEFAGKWKPVFPREIHFNISHSRSQVICGFSQRRGSLGWGLGKKINANRFWKDFRQCFQRKRWSCIHSADDPLRTFYWFWTTPKEKVSFQKAMGRHLNICIKLIGCHFRSFYGWWKRFFCRNWYCGKFCGLQFATGRRIESDWAWSRLVLRFFFKNKLLIETFGRFCQPTNVRYQFW